MAKSKKKTGSHSSGSSGRSRRLKKGVVYQAKMLLGTVLFVFLFASIFDKAGAWGNKVHLQLTRAVGTTTPVMAVVLLWYLAKRYFPRKFGLHFLTILGLIVFWLCLNGLLHSFVTGDPLEAAYRGEGGGMIGNLVSNAFISALGVVVGRLLLFVLLFIAIMLIFNKEIPLLFQMKEEEEEEDVEDDQAEEAQIPVKGAIRLNPFSKLKKKLNKPPVVELNAAKKGQMDILARPPMRMSNWNYPPVSLLDIIDMKPQSGNIQKRMDLIQKTLRDFGIDVTMGDVNIGPTVTQYTLKPADGVKLNQITARQDDLALALAAQSLRVEAPIPGKGLVGIEIPNDKKAVVGLRDILESKAFKARSSKLAIALGRDAAGAEVVADLEKMPHVLIAGATGSGKSVCINSVILTLLMNNSPDELRMILVDPKRVELSGYNGLPHLLTPVITESQDTVKALKYCVEKMEYRYKLFARTGKRNIEQYNQEPDLAEGRLPYIVLIIDELADLMMVAAREVEASIVRLAQMARAVGIHLIVATQRPSVDVITGLIKANIPTRIAFAVASQIDSRTIIDMSGAEKLLGNGDMLYISTEIGRPKRIQGVYATEREITAVSAHIKIQEPHDRYDPAVLETRIESRLGGTRSGGEGGEIDDDLFEEAYEVVRQAGKASSTLLQTRLSVGYARAARLMQAMEDKGLIGPAKGSKPREVYGSAQGADDDDGSGIGIASYLEKD